MTSDELIIVEMKSHHIFICNPHQFVTQKSNNLPKLKTLKIIIICSCQERKFFKKYIW